MVLNAPDWDETLSGHAAVELTRSPGVVHAAVSDYDEQGRKEVTECGLEVAGDESTPRMDFDDSGLEWCGECWPQSVLELE